MDARAEQPHQPPEQTGAAGRRHEFVAAQPEVERQQYKPGSGQRLMGESAHRQRREEHKHPRTQHTAPQFSGLAGAHDDGDGGLALVAPAKCGLHARNAGNDGLRQSALHHVAEQPPPAKILEPGGQDAAQQLKQQRRQRERIGKQNAGAEGIDCVVVRADIRQMYRAAAEQLPPEVVLRGVGAGVVQDPVNAGGVQHPHTVQQQKDQRPQ